MTRCSSSPSAAAAWRRRTPSTSSAPSTKPAPPARASSASWARMAATRNSSPTSACSSPSSRRSTSPPTPKDWPRWCGTSSSRTRHSRRRRRSGNPCGDYGGEVEAEYSRSNSPMREFYSASREALLQKYSNGENGTRQLAQIPHPQVRLDCAALVLRAAVLDERDLAAGGAAASEIAVLIADHPRLREIDVELARRFLQKVRTRLAADAAVIGMMKTDIAAGDRKSVV